MILQIKIDINNEIPKNESKSCAVENNVLLSSLKLTQESSSSSSTSNRLLFILILSLKVLHL